MCVTASGDGLNMQKNFTNNNINININIFL